MAFSAENTPQKYAHFVNINFAGVDFDYEMVFVNDGSRDSSWSMIRQLAEQDPHYAGITLSRNRGHQNALYAGLMYAKDRCDLTISIDCDGQDDVAAMEEMVRKYLTEGCEIVYGVRSARDTVMVVSAN